MESSWYGEAPLDKGYSHTLKQHEASLVYGVRSGDGSGYNRGCMGRSTQSKVGGAIQMKDSAARRLKQVPAGYLVVGVDSTKRSTPQWP